MSDQTGQNTEASVSAERERERESESKESEEMREMREDIEVLKRALEEQKLRAQRAVLATEVERGAGGGRRRDAAARNSTSSSTMPLSLIHI